MNFKEANIKGIILNNITESYYNLLKAAIERNCNLKVLGYLPKDDRLVLKSRHLGLIQSSEIEDLEEKIEICAGLLEKHCNLDLLLEEFKETQKYADNFHVENKGKRIAVAYDKAFSFYYKENLELLQEMGEIIYFSPLKDKQLPSNIDFLYIGGGYPEVFIEELSKNTSMLVSINTALSNGLRCYAECGGLMYLTQGENLGEQDEISHNLVGFFKGSYTITKRLQNFGYAKMQVGVDNNILSTGMSINCHEFHKSTVSLREDKIINLSKQVYDGTEKNWKCGYVVNNTLAAYGHVHFFGNLSWFKEIFR